MLAPRPYGYWVLAIWLGSSGLLALVAVLWAVCHPRAWLRHAIPVWRWGFWVAVGASAIAYADGGPTLSRLLGDAIPRSLLLFVGLGLFPALLVAAALLGLLGTAIGAFVTRASGRPSLVAVSPAVWWMSALALVLLDGFFRYLGASGSRCAAVLGGTPLLTAATAYMLRQRAEEPEVIARHLAQWMARRLVLHTRIGRSAGVVDLRGPGIGVMVGVVVLGIQAMGLLTPFRASVLGAMVHMRASMHRPDPATGLPILPVYGTGEVTLLQINPAVRRTILTSGSEAAVQAEVIQRLSHWGVRDIVLPMPEVFGGPEGASNHAAARTIRGLTELVSAVRAAGNVLLVDARADRLASRTIRPTPSQSEELALARELTHAAIASCACEVPTFGATQIPSIPTQWKGPVPAAIYLLAARRGRRPVVSQVAGRPHLARIAGKVVPLIADHRVLVDFRTDDPAYDFFSASYTSVLDDAMLLIPSRLIGLSRPEGQTMWVDPARFYRGRIVFLDSLEDRRIETPVGATSAQDVLAHATATLLDGSPTGQVHPFVLVALVLGVGALLGGACQRRSPLDAGWRAAAMMFVLVAVSIYAFMALSIWVDVVAPSLAILASFLLTNQLTYGLERRGREVNRSLLERFVAPEVVEELLDNPETKLGLGGKRQTVCVLFADIRNFTGFAERHTPEEVIEVVNTFMTALTEVLHRHRGLLDKYTGDGLMAMFRIGECAEADVMRAVRAALEMRTTAIRIAAEQAAVGHDPLGVGIGLHCGEAVVGLVGNPRQFNYTALGHTVVVAERLQAAALAGEVLVSDAVAAMLGGRLPLEEREPLCVRGASEPMRLYAVSEASLAGQPAAPQMWQPV